MTATQLPSASLTWTDSADAAFQDSYLDWSETLRTRRGAADMSGDRFEPIFVRLTGQDARAALVALLDAPSGDLRMDPHERAFLDARMAATDPYQGMDDCYALYRRFGVPDADHAAVFTVMDTGVPVQLRQGTIAATPPSLPKSDMPGQPIVAVVDDAIGFLNARFRKGNRSRVHGVWLQALERGDHATGGVAAGSVLTREQIDALLDQDEDTAYARLFEDHLTAASATGLWRSVWHGTHVLDLAGGADPGDVAENWPLLAVQLPPEAIEDTSGTRAESYLVQGVRWILRNAQQIDPTAPVIINLSLGIVAGAKDGSRFAEWQIAREAAQWEAATGQKVRVVWAFGNAYRDNLIGGFGFDAAEGRSDAERALTWRVQPDDQSANYCEIRTHGAASDAILVSLTEPDGTQSGFQTMAPGQVRSLVRRGKAVARIYHVPERRYTDDETSPAHYVVATAPTDAFDLTEPRADAGPWRIGLRYDGDEALHVSLQIQRDDALRGHRGQARQSYLDDPCAYAWDDVWQQHTGLSRDGAIRHEGSHSAFASALGRQVFTVGAARRDDRNGGWDIAEYRASDYSAEGADWAASGPTLSVPVDGGPFQSGVMGAGRVSGTVRFSNGTSAAAGRLSRALALSATEIGNSSASGTPSDDLNRNAVRMIAATPGDASRLGAFVVEMPDEKAARR